MDWLNKVTSRQSFIQVTGSSFLVTQSSEGIDRILVNIKSFTEKEVINIGVPVCYLKSTKTAEIFRGFELTT